MVARRNVEVLRDWAGRPPAGHRRRIHLRFFLRPAALLGEDRVAGVRFERTVPDGQGGVRGSGELEDIDAQLVLRSVGYRGVAMEGLPFDEALGIVPNEQGRVLRDGRRSPGEYVAGWIKRGPTGVIGTNRPCAKETASALLADAGALLSRGELRRTRWKGCARRAASRRVDGLGGHRSRGGGARPVPGPGDGQDPGLGGPVGGRDREPRVTVRQHSGRQQTVHGP